MWVLLTLVLFQYSMPFFLFSDHKTRFKKIYSGRKPRGLVKNKPKNSVLFNKNPDLDHWILFISTAVRSNSPRKANKLQEIKMNKSIMWNTMLTFFTFEYSWISPEWNSVVSWQMNVITCCEEHNRYNYLREESTWMEFCCVFINLDLSKQCTHVFFLGESVWTELLKESHERTVVYRTPIKFWFVCSHIPPEHLQHI